MLERPEYYYKQSATIPFRLRDGSVEVMLVSSRKMKHWVVPKGIIEPGLTAAESALKEAWEEAGIQGKLVGGSIGRFVYEKWGGNCSVEVFVLKVEEVRETWMESFRNREWFSLSEAIRRIDVLELKTMIANLPQFLENTRTR